MEDQTNFLRKFGRSDGLIGEDKALGKESAPWQFRRRSPFQGTGRWLRFPRKTGPLHKK